MIYVSQEIKLFFFSLIHRVDTDAAGVLHVAKQ